MKEKYYKSFLEFWLPTYKRIYFKCKLSGDIETIMSLKENIMKNWNLDKNQKENIWRKIIGNEKNN